MVSLAVHAILGMAVIVWIVRANPQIFARPAEGLAFSVLEIVFYVVGVASIALGYYFNHQFVAQYAVERQHRHENSAKGLHAIPA